MAYPIDHYPAWESTLDRTPFRALEVGIVNNMGDSGLRVAERHFADLIRAASITRAVNIHLFHIPEIPRGRSAAAHLDVNYRKISDLYRTPLDGLIVTGAEPRNVLSQEPYWEPMRDVIDWAERNTISSIFSCLAAHAAVLHLDGIERRRLSTKCSGVFDFAHGGESPLLEGMPTIVSVPHSRWNEVTLNDLTACGYQILTYSPGVGADIFVKRSQSLFVFLQGHPEYESDTLLREYRRDLGRYFRGESSFCPAPPHGYGDDVADQGLVDLGTGASHVSSGTAVDTLERGLSVEAPWRRSSVTFLRNWLTYLAANKI
jgi:homoserine O-succinyltransferase